MNEITFLQHLQNPLDNVQLILERPSVQYQIWAFITIFLIGWLIPNLSKRLFRSWIVDIVQSLHDIKMYLPMVWQERVSRSMRALGHIGFPMIGILMVAFTIQIFRGMGWHSGLLGKTQTLFWGFLGYRLLIAALYVLMEETHAQSYHQRVMRPLMLIVAIASINRVLSGVVYLSEVDLVTLAGNTITLTLLYKAAVIFYFFYIASWVLRDIADRLLLPWVAESPGLANSVLTLSHYVIMSVGFLVVLGILGVNFETLAFIGAGLSVGIGFGLQELVANFISGILLLFEQSIRPGDVVRVGENVGTVEKLRIRSTLIRTFDSLEIIVPNQQLLTSTVTNYTHTDQIVRARLIVHTGYQNDPEQVCALLRSIAERHELIRKDPKPRVFFDHFGESRLDFELLIWLDNMDGFKQVPSELRCTIWEEFKQRGIEVPFPQRDLHIRTADAVDQLPDNKFWGLVDSPFQQTASTQSRKN